MTTKNPAWEMVVQSVLEQVKFELGLETKTAKAELAALIYYEPGSTMEMAR